MQTGKYLAFLFLLGFSAEILVVEEHKPVGGHSINFEAINLSSVGYFYHLTLDEGVPIIKMILLK